MPRVCLHFLCACCCFSFIYSHILYVTDYRVQLRMCCSKSLMRRWDTILLLLLLFWMCIYAEKKIERQLKTNWIHEIEMDSIHRIRCIEDICIYINIYVYLQIYPEWVLNLHPCVTFLQNETLSNDEKYHWYINSALFDISFVKTQDKLNIHIILWLLILFSFFFFFALSK